MRSSVLSRSVIAVATLAIGSVALAAVPSTAATTSGVTRDQVLAAAAGLRTDAPTATQGEALTDVVERACTVLADESVDFQGGTALTAGDDADGLIVSTVIYPSGRHCSFAALAASDASFRLSGTATVTSRPNGTQLPTSTLYSGRLSGDAFVTTPFVADSMNQISASALGGATKTTKVTTTTKITDKKSKIQKKKAKQQYVKRLATAKKQYAKSLKRAGSSKTKRAAAKTTYRAATSSAKATYKRAISSVRLVTRTSNVTEHRSFSLIGSYSYTP